MPGWTVVSPVLNCGNPQAAVADYLFGPGEATTVAELGPHRHRDQPTDAVGRLDQRSARRLAMTETLQLPLQQLGLDVGGLEHRVADPHSLLAGGGQATSPLSNRSRVDVERIAPSGTATPCWTNSAWIRWIHTRR